MTLTAKKSWGEHRNDNVYNRIRTSIFRLLNAKFGTETERMKYFSSFVTKYHFDSILDTGCGKGLLFDHIENLNESKPLIGVDLQRKKGKRYQHIVADATRSPFKNDAFSLVTASSLLEHIPKTDRKQFYKEMQSSNKGTRDSTA